MRHDVGEVVGAPRLQVDVVDGVGHLGGVGDVVAGELEATGRRFDPRGEQEGVGPVSGRGRVAGGVERGQDPLRASAVAEDDPGPTEPVDDARARAAGRARRSRSTRRRCWPARPGRRRGARPGRLLRTPSVDDAAASANHAAWAAKPALGQPGVGHRLERERADAVEQPVADRRRPALVVDDHERTAREPADDVDRRGSPAPRALRGRTRPPASGAPPAKVARAHRPRWSSGNSSS